MISVYVCYHYFTLNLRNFQMERIRMTYLYLCSPLALDITEYESRGRDSRGGGRGLFKKYSAINFTLRIIYTKSWV